MNYVIHVSSTNNSFIGTGFMGTEVSSFEDVKQAMLKYATFIRDGKQYWRKEIKLTFNLASTLEAIKSEGNRQCQENGFVNLFTVLAACKSDPFKDYTIVYRPGKWVDTQGNKFSLVLLKGNEVIPFSGKLSELLTQIGIVF